MKILILEDDPIREESFIRKLGLTPSEVNITSNVRKALYWFARYPFDVLFLDHDLSQCGFRGLVDNRPTGLDFVNGLLGEVDSLRKIKERKQTFFVHSLDHGTNKAMYDLLRHAGAIVFQTPRAWEEPAKLVQVHYEIVQPGKAKGLSKEAWETLHSFKTF